MKKLILVRHGKSSWDNDLPDDERPLKKRAYKDADFVISAFKSHWKDEVLTLKSSYAVRALTTANIFKDQLEIANQDFEINEDLYTFDGKQLLKTISGVDDSINNLMVFGHNPAMTSVANSLGSQHFKNIPTTGLVLIEFQTDSWNNLKDGKTILYLFPKNLR
ncbi:SixA phosphatase family protein [Salinimicrobium gaetbulicola]|uniref:SixA phosphatase family protein n=1 Tax=Salinimicrobium gaetbulicola TaxID=999702 RepID=A0ABW3IGQ6_9FLAO